MLTVIKMFETEVTDLNDVCILRYLPSIYKRVFFFLQKLDKPVLNFV
jgi:hypothetical protein